MPWVERRPLLVVISGPSGVGKDAVLRYMKRKGAPYHFAVTATTRPRRPGEQEGLDYFFLTPETFHRKREQGEFLEWARVYGHWYGVPKGPLKQALDRGQDVLLKVDIQGAATIRKLAPEAVFIFLAPSSLEELEERLRHRESESTFDFNLRLDTSREEMKHLSLFDYCVVNRKDALEEAVSQIEAIITAEKCRLPPRRVEL